MASQVEKRRPEARTFPEPMTVPPQLEHRQTFIILHGRGSTAEKFGPPLLASTAPDGEALQTAFPHAKIIFPVAFRNRATIYKRAYTHQWFDNWHLEDHTKRQDLQRDGLKKSVSYIHSLLQAEILLVGRENVVLWGLSQGCATSLASLLAWDGEPFAAMVGMCGWLPFGHLVAEIGGDDDSDLQSDDLFGVGDDAFFHHSGDEEKDTTDPLTVEVKVREGAVNRAREAVDFFRAEIDIESSTGIAFKKIPIFLGHGTEDEKVSIELGREAKTSLELIGADIRLVEYEGLGHWYSGEMLSDIFKFLKESLDIEEGEDIP